MTPAEFDAWRQEMGFTFPQAATAIGKSVRQCKAYASGEAKIPLTVALACRYLLSTRRGTVVLAEAALMQREGENQTGDSVREV